jgi:hypothetical protein
MVARIALSASALALALGFSGAANAALLCSKTNAQGKTKFSLRETCKSTETLVGTVAITQDVTDGLAGVRRTRIFGFDSDNNFLNTTTTGAAVPIDGANTSVVIDTTAASTDMMITFHSECQLQNAVNWTVVEIFVDGVAFTSAGGDQAFCSLQQYATNSMTVVAPNLPAGSHTISVQAINTGGSGFLDDNGLSVITTED